MMNHPNLIILILTNLLHIHSLKQVPTVSGFYKMICYQLLCWNAAKILQVVSEKEGDWNEPLRTCVTIFFEPVNV